VPEIVAIRTEPAELGPEHEHVALVGYYTPHIPYEPLMIPPERIKEKMLVLETFWIVDPSGEKVDVVPGSCPVCAHEPYLRTAKDSGDTELLKNLPPA
jgi:hypothetical protein